MSEHDSEYPGTSPSDPSRPGDQYAGDQQAGDGRLGGRESIAGSETRTQLESVDQRGQQQDTQRLLAGRYRLESLLGRGSMGAVWKARDVVLGRSVAVKEVLLPTTQTDEENHVARERALREARSIAALSHPNVVTLYDVVEDDGRPWVVMELVPAKSLAQIIKDDGTLPPAEAARIGVAVLAALNSAHEVGITHRDVKPGNILVSPDGRVKLADFGISRRAEDSQLTRTGLMVGSPSYIAPEVARGREAGPAADIWGLGATLQCAVEGTPPFDLGDPVATLTAVVGDPPRPAHNAGPLQPLLARMLDKDPRTRIRTGELRDELESVASSRPGPRPTYAPPTGPLAQPTSGPMPGPYGAGAPPTGAQTAYAQGPRPPMPAGPGARGAQPIMQPTGQYGAATGYGPAYGASPAYGGPPGTGYHPMQTPSKPKRNPWIPAVIGLVVAALIAGGVFWYLSSKDDDSNGNAGGSGTATGTVSPSEPPTSSETSETTTTPPPTSNDTQLAADGTASGAIKVSGEFRAFSFTLPAGWQVGTFDESRSEFLLESGGENPQTMVKVTVVAEPLQAASVDAQIQSQMDQQGSPATLPNYQEIQYKVTDQNNVLWQYTNKYKGADRRGYFYAADKGGGVLWKVITSGPADEGSSTSEVANNVIKTFTA